MGNIGRSSTGCYLCRKRKIKCDEGKPGCKKCAQIRKTCPGYPFSVELDVRNSGSPPATPVTPSLQSQETQSLLRPSVLHSLSESRVTQLKSIVPRITPAPTAYAIDLPTPVSEITLSQAPSVILVSDTDSESADSSLQDGRSSSVKVEGPSLDRTLSVIPVHRKCSPPPRYDVQHQSTCFFLNLFVWQASQSYGASVLDYLPEMLLQSQPDSCLHMALKAVSRMTLADRYSGCDVRLQTGKEYVKALSATKATIRNSSEAVKDETFMAVWLLGLYENINSVLSHGRLDRQHQAPEEEYQSHVSHIRGAMNLLRIRGRSQLDNRRSEKIYRIFKAAIQMRLFNLNSVESSDFENLEYDVYQQEHEFLPSQSARKATDYFHSCAQLLEQAKYTVRKCKELSDASDMDEELLEMVEQAENMDADMSGWYRHEGETGWEMMRVRDNTYGTMWALYPSHATYYFVNFWVFLYWLRYFIARLKLYEGLIVLARYQKKVALKQMQTSSGTGLLPDKSRSKQYDFKIQQYRTVIQLVAGQIIGLTAYALGDITNEGYFHSSSLSEDGGPTAGARESNVIAGLQLVIPLKVLQRSDSPTPTQRGAIDLALSHIGDGFRRQPVLV